MKSVFLFLGSISALVGVGMGAFGSHALKASLSLEQLTIYQTGVSYQMWHALGLISIALALLNAPTSKLLRWAGTLMFIGVVLFSGSLYLLVLLDMKILGIITPIGGVCFIFAWALLTIYAAKKPHINRYTHDSQ
jgi:uncharacterized membrane protein YgdD (TMEM256/DUF423 family)